MAQLGEFGLENAAVIGVRAAGDPGALLEFPQVLAHALRGDERSPRQLRVGQARLLIEGTEHGVLADGGVVRRSARAISACNAAWACLIRKPGRS